jgi:hypothetical protein
MNDEKPSGDAGMTNLLREWKTDSSLPPGFRDRVWRRIEEAGAPMVGPLTRLRDWVTRIFGRPAMAFSYVAILLLAGGTLGFWHGHRNSARAATELSARYVQLMGSYESPRRP